VDEPVETEANSKRRKPDPIYTHWGKLTDVDAESLRLMYGEDVDAWLAALRRLLPDATHRHLFSNRFLEDLGLDD